MLKHDLGIVIAGEEMNDAPGESEEREMEWSGPLAADGLDVWFGFWLDGVVAFVAAVLAVGLIALVSCAIVSMWSTPPTSRRRFWCRHASREVEVEFAVRGLCRALAGVRSCSAFEGGAIECRRRCLDAAFRQQWEPALPVVRSSPRRNG